MLVDGVEPPIDLIGANIRRLRQAIGITSTQLARRAGISQSYVSELESGNRSPSLSTLFAIADILNTTPAAILEVAGDPDPVRIVRSSRGTEIQLTEESDGVQMQSLFQMDGVSVFQLDSETEGEIGARFQHSGHEFVFVVEGALEVAVGDGPPLVLEAGDSVSYDADEPHSWDRHQGRPFKVIEILVNPTPEY